MRTLGTHDVEALGAHDVEALGTHDVEALGAHDVEALGAHDVEALGAHDVEATPRPVDAAAAVYSYRFGIAMSTATGAYCWIIFLCSVCWRAFRFVSWHRTDAYNWNTTGILLEHEYVGYDDKECGIRSSM
jgi:hypothetical protein